MSADDRVTAPDGPEAAPMPEPQLNGLRRDLELQHDYDRVREQFTALRRALEHFEARLLDDVCEGDVAMQARLADYAEQLAAILAKYPEAP